MIFFKRTCWILKYSISPRITYIGPYLRKLYPFCSHANSLYVLRYWPISFIDTWYQAWSAPRCFKHDRTSLGATPWRGTFFKANWLVSACGWEDLLTGLVAGHVINWVPSCLPGIIHGSNLANNLWRVKRATLQPLSGWRTSWRDQGPINRSPMADWF